MLEASLLFDPPNTCAIRFLTLMDWASPWWQTKRLSFADSLSQLRQDRAVCGRLQQMQGPVQLDGDGGFDPFSAPQPAFVCPCRATDAIVTAYISA
jgi:hypothetical protein